MFDVGNVLLCLLQEAALDVSVEDRLCVVKFNRPHKKNAFRAKVSNLAFIPTCSY